MDQSVGPRPVANGYTNARTNKLTLTQTQVKCFNSCQKTCKTHFAFRFLQPSCPWGRASRGSPGPCPGLGFSAAGWQSSVREEVLGITGGRDGEKDGGSAQPTAGATMASQSRRRGAGSPGGSVVGPGVLSAGHIPNPEESEPSSLAHPSAERQGGGTQAQKRHCGRGAR